MNEKQNQSSVSISNESRCDIWNGHDIGTKQVRKKTNRTSSFFEDNTKTNIGLMKMNNGKNYTSL